MKLTSTFIFLLSFYSSAVQSQSNEGARILDSSLARKITISGFCLCKTSLSALRKLDNNLKKVEVEEMDAGKKCFAQDSRYENGIGYYSEKFPGTVFQKDQDEDEISKIRLTRDFKGNLPDGTPIDLKNLKLKDVFKIYPYLKEKWGSRPCSDYWSFSNDTLFFYVKIDTTKKPQFPIDEAYYYEKPVEAIDLTVSCYGIFEKHNDRYKQLMNDPVFFIDSVNVTRIELQQYKPADIAFVTVYKDTNAIKLVGEQGKFGAVYIETKKFARNRYWRFLSGKSASYLKTVPTPQSDSMVVYILNAKVLKKNLETDLAGIDDRSFIELTIIDKDQLKRDYNIQDKTFGVVIKIKAKDKKD